MLNQQLVPELKYGVKCPYTMNPKGICIHNTANDAPAKNEASYMTNNNNEVSFHAVIDDVEAIQVIPFNRNAWHAGDGGGGQGNRNYIAIEICYSKSGGDKFAKAEQRAVKEVAEICRQYGWNSGHIKSHKDFSGKNCPHRSNVEEFKRAVQRELDGTSQPNTPPVAPKPPAPSYDIDRIINQYVEHGTCHCTEDIFFRNEPRINGTHTQGEYYKGESVIYDYVVITEGYVWVSWISASTGIRRYMPITDRRANEKWAYCV